LRRTRVFSGAILGLLLWVPAAEWARAESLDEASARYKVYAVEQIEQSLAGAVSLRKNIDVHDLLGAQNAWLGARGGWERSEVFTDEFFPKLAAAIDAWPNATAGFHAIEAKIFGAHQVDVAPLVDALVDNLKQVDAGLRTTQLSPQGLLNGSVKLAYEVGENKGNGGESQFSGTSLDDVRYNIVGIKTVYINIFQPTLEQKNAKAATLIEADIEALQKLAKAPNIKDVDEAKLRALSEELAVTLRSAAPDLGLETPRLDD
jgi:iron uptake system component EfeO